MNAKCGSTAGYQVHRNERSTPCQPCRDAMAKDENRRRLLHMQDTPPTVPAIGTQRRIRALMCLGWTAASLGERLGCSAEHVQNIVRKQRAFVRRATAEKIAALYDELSMRPGPSAISARRAEARGWSPPLAWDDIDDPTCEPQGVAARRRHVEHSFTEAGRRRAHAAYSRGERDAKTVAGEREYQRMRREAAQVAS